MKKLMIGLLSICCLQAAELRVDLSQAGKKVSPNLFGIFLEEINHAGDGGLYAELIRNGSFTEATTLDAWSAVRMGSARVNLFFDSSMPLNPVKSRSLRIETKSPSGERAGVANEGYWGIAAKKGESYQFSMYARGGAGFDGPPNAKSPFGVLEKHRIPVSDFPLEQMGPIVQEALDAIEYANGPVTSTWGALRAKAGHPAPFGLKYIEIGNEDGFNPLYTDRYMLFYNAIKARFPEIQIIANERRGRTAQLPMDLVDEHIYTRPLGAIDMAKRLDDRDRNGPNNAQAEFQDGKGTGTGDNYTYSVRARKTGGGGGIVIRFAQNGSGTYLAWFIGVRHRASTLHVWGGGGMLDVPAHQLESSFSGPVGRQVNGTLDTGRWYDVKIQVEGRRVRCSLDGREIHDVQVPESLGPSVYGSAGRTVAGEVVLRLVNASPLKQNASIDLAGGSANRYSAVSTHLTSKNLDDENSLAEPTRIAPIERQLPSVGSKFQCELEGNSFTVLKLTPEGR